MAQGVNKYLPPDFDPVKHKTANGFTGVHALGARARKLATEGTLVIRFELPFAFWCDGCGQLVPQATRYNAAKKQVGKYYSTPIFSFTFKCRECRKQDVVIETDPANATYRLVSGGRRKHEPVESAADGDGDAPRVLDTEAGAQRRAGDAMAQLEHRVADEARAHSRQPLLAELEALRAAQFKDDYSSGAAARRLMREQKRAQAAEALARRGHICPPSIRLLAADEADAHAAARVPFAQASASRKRKAEVSIFGNTPELQAEHERARKRRRLVAGLASAISNHVAREPVVDKTRGFLYERRLVADYIAEHGKCPHTGEPLSVDDLLPVQGSRMVEPRPASATSVPAMMSLFQNEWDALMRESFELRKQLHETRQELATAMYQQDAACRVIARLVKERDEARALLTASRGTAAAAGAPMQVDGGAAPTTTEADETLPKALAKQMDKTAKALAKARRSFAPPASLQPASKLARYAVHESLHPHSPSAPPVLCVALDPKNASLIVTGGTDKNAVVFDIAAKSEVAVLKGHTRAVNAVAVHREAGVIVTGSDDGTARVWEAVDGGAYRKKHQLKGHDGPIVAVSLHAVPSIVCTFSHDCSWALWDIDAGTLVCRVTDANPLTCGELHPDGLILATGGVDGQVRIWNVKQQAALSSLAHAAAITSVSFSENGFYLASASADGEVKLWDLRSQECFRTISFAQPVKRVRFDASGSYLGVCHGNELTVLADFAVESPQHTTVHSWAAHKDLVNDVAFGPDAGCIVTVAADRCLKVLQ